MKRQNVVTIFVLLMSVFQTSCEGSSSEALKALERMKAKDYFEDQVQIEFATAVAKGNEARMRELLQQGADVNAVGRQEMRPLFWALGKQSLDGFRFLLENGANPNVEAKDLPGEKRPLSLIELAAIAENSDYLRLLLKHGADPNHDVGYGKRTLIYEAILNNRTENVRLLIEAGANIDHQDLSGSTPMMTAAGIKNFDMVHLLLGKGADVRLENRWGNDLAWMVMEFGDRGMKKGGEQYRWYQKVVEELKKRGLLGDEDRKS